MGEEDTKDVATRLGLRADEGRLWVVIATTVNQEDKTQQPATSVAFAKDQAEAQQIIMDMQILDGMKVAMYKAVGTVKKELIDIEKFVV